MGERIENILPFCEFSNAEEANQVGDLCLAWRRLGLDETLLAGAIYSKFHAKTEGTMIDAFMEAFNGHRFQI